MTNDQRPLTDDYCPMTNELMKKGSKRYLEEIRLPDLNVTLIEDFEE